MKVLIAEDQIQTSKILAGLLDSWGYEVFVVHDGKAALDALQAINSPRLALLDWQMPGLDGIEVCRHVRSQADSPYTYLMIMTGQGGRQQMLEGLEAGADDFLSKPVDDAELKVRLAAGRRVISLQEQLRDLATRDALTTLWNRSAVLNLLNNELSRGGREGKPAGVILADLDHFKRINDTLGHLAGDHVLREVSRRMLTSLRPYDLIGRFGGEEFLIVLPGCDRLTTYRLAERLRVSVSEEPFVWEGEPLDITLSLGVAAWLGGQQANAIELLRTADEALYQAKRSGRNQTVLAGAPAVSHS